MTISTQAGSFQAFNSHNSKAQPSAIKKSPMTTNDESPVFGCIPYSIIRTSIGIDPLSPDNIIKPIAMTPN